MSTNHHCSCTEPNNENSKYYFHGIDIVQNDGGFLRSFEIEGCEASSGQNKFTVACYNDDSYDASCPEDASSSVTILLIIAGLVCLILLAVVFKMHRRIKELEEKNSNQDQENKGDVEKQASC